MSKSGFAGFVPILAVGLLAISSIAGVIPAQPSPSRGGFCSGHCSTIAEPACGGLTLPCCCIRDEQFRCICILPTDCNANNDCEDGGAK